MDAAKAFKVAAKIDKGIRAPFRRGEGVLAFVYIVLGDEGNSYVGSEISSAPKGDRARLIRLMKSKLAEIQDADACAG